jgi:hypothetical protein
MHFTSFLWGALPLLCLPSLACGRSLPSRSPATHVPQLNQLDARSLVTSAINIAASPSSNNTYVRAAQLSDNSILLGYAHHDGVIRTISVLRSTDGGKTFSPYGTVAERDSGADMDNIFFLEVPGSSPPHVRAAFRNHDENSAGTYTEYRITVCRSTDGGATWAFLSQAATRTPTASQQLGIWEPFMRINAKGQVALTYSYELAANNQETYLVTSSDGGTTWTAPVNLKIHSTSESLRDGMQGIAAVTDQGNGAAALVMVLETTRRSTSLFSVEYAVSYNDGATWGNRSTVYVPSATRNAGSPQIANWGAHGLAVIFMTDESTATQGWPSIADVKTLASAGGLKNGVVIWNSAAAPELVSKSPSHWPGLLSMGTQVMALYDSNAVAMGKFLNWS